MPEFDTVRYNRSDINIHSGTNLYRLQLFRHTALPHLEDPSAQASSGYGLPTTTETRLRSPCPLFGVKNSNVQSLQRGINFAVDIKRSQPAFR
jgi:hypothetical protein